MKQSATMPYNKAFFDWQKESALQSAAKAVPFILSFLSVDSVVDVGCGTGVWLSVFKNHGVTRVLGIDGEYVRESGLSISEEEFLAHDLREPLEIGASFDLALSLEVAEHLPEDNADDFVALLCDLAPTVIFSAALPGQGGTDHVNEQPPAYWAEKFAGRGYRCLDVLRPAWWEDPDIAPWYSQNALIFTRCASEGALERRSFPAGGDGKPMALVHPALYAKLGEYAGWLENRLTTLEGVTTRQLLGRLPAALAETIRWRLERHRYEQL